MKVIDAQNFIDELRRCCFLVENLKKGLYPTENKYIQIDEIQIRLSDTIDAGADLLECTALYPTSDGILVFGHKKNIVGKSFDEITSSLAKPGSMASEQLPGEKPMT